MNERAEGVHRSEMTPSPLLSAAPIVVFLAVNRIAGLRWAVIVATACSLLLVVNRRRQGLPLGKFMPIITAAVLIRGAIGAITGSETVYFGLGIATKYGVAVVLAASVALRRPLAELGAPAVLDVSGAVRQHPQFRRAMRDLTIIATLYYLASASFDVWLFRNSGVERFVVVRFLANWPFTALVLAGAATVATHRLSKIPGLDPLPELIERRLAAISQPPGVVSSHQPPESGIHDDPTNPSSPEPLD